MEMMDDSQMINQFVLDGENQKDYHRWASPVSPFTPYAKG
jgi:hypothetical protein